MHEGLPKPENNSEKSSVKEGVDFVFDQHPELTAIGTKEQYSEYLKNIFPNSLVKTMVYHGGDVSTFITREEGTYFTKNKEYALDHSNRIVPAMINITRGARLPFISKTSIAVTYKDQLKDGNFDGVVGEEEMGIVTKNDKTFLARGESYAVFEPDQIHILGLESDREKFKEFVG